jgi:type II secretory pathway component PulJ
MTESTSQLAYTVDRNLTVAELRRQTRAELEPEQDLRLHAKDALDRLRQHFEQTPGRRDTEGRARAHLDLVLVGYWLKDKALQQTARHFDYRVAKELATNLEERRRYVQVTMPRHPVVRALPVSRQLPDSPERA